MLKKKAKRLLAGLCVALMLTETVYNDGLIVSAAGNTPDTAVQESAASETAEDVSAGEVTVVDAVADDASETEIPVVGPEEDWASAVVMMERTPSSHDGGDLIWYGTDPETSEVITYATLDAEGVLTIGKDVDVVTYKFYDPNNEAYKNDHKAMSALDQAAYDNAATPYGARIKKLQFESGAKAKAIAYSCFWHCTNLEEIDLTNATKVTLIDEKAFKGCTGLTEIKFNETLQEIRKNAFEGCTSLRSITFKSGLIGVEEQAFTKCSNLEHVRIEAANMSCRTRGGGVATEIFKDCNIKSFELAAQATEEVEDRKSVIVPANLFNKATFDQTVTIKIPYYIQEIGEGAFKESNIKNIEFENTDEHASQLSVIGKEAFKDCKMLEAVNFHSTLKTIGEGAFQQCEALTTLVIPNSVTRIDSSAFKSCKKIADLTLSNATATLGEHIFEECIALPEVEIPSGTNIGAYEFKSCTALTKVTIADSVTEIGKGAFSDCIHLPGIVLPSGITEVQDETFKNCTSLVTAVVPEGVTRIGNSAFEECRVLESNVFPQSLVELGNRAYYFCLPFTNITIPANVEKIGSSTFAECQRLNTITLESLKISSCGDGIFGNCLARAVVFPEGITEIPGKLFSQAKFTTDVTITIPKTVTKIGYGAFGGTQANPVNVSKFEFEEGTQIEEIGDSAFTYCTAIESFTIPDSVKKIGSNAFAYCTKLPSIIIPENVEEIGGSAFAFCSSLTNITYNAINVKTKNDNIFQKCNVKTIIIGPKVVTFPAKLFKGAQFSKNQETGEVDYFNITIPAATEEIGEAAFTNISNLQKVVFAEGSKLTTIGVQAFQECPNLTVCNLPESVTTIGNFAFDGCTLLGTDKTTPFALPANLESLGSGAYRGCPGIENAVIGVYVKEIPNEAFKGDTGLKTVTFQGMAVTKIGDSAFENCSALETINIPNSVESIGVNAFKGCTNLRKVLLPASLTKIGNDAFSGCDFAEFYVVPGSYAETWLSENGLTGKAKLLTKINYELDGGINNAANPGGYEPGKDTFEFQNPEKPGYKFLGWYAESSFTTPVKGVTGATGEMTIYAKWELATYTITYVLNAEGAINPAENPTTYQITDDTISLKSPTADGFKFEGWFTDPEMKDTKTKMSQIKKGSYGDLILYAKWTGNNAVEPVANIASSTVVRTGTMVKLTTKSSGASIYYTLDGSIPTTLSTKYNGSIKITTNVTIKAIAAGPGYLPSTVAEFTYSVLPEAADWGDILEEDQTGYATASAVPKGIWVAGVTDATYTGSAITFDLRVYDNKTLLTANTDYTVKYKNNKVAADAGIGKKAPTITIKGKNSYKGTLTVNFTIQKRDISGDDVIGTAEYGKGQKVVSTLWYGGKKLKLKKEYTVSEGGGTVTFTGAGNFTGTKSVAMNTGDSASKVKISKAGFSYKPATYTGATMDGDDIQLKITYSGKTLEEGKDFVLNFLKNRDAGTATMMVIGTGDFTGSVKKTFKIEAADISKLDVKLIDEAGEEQEKATYSYELGGPKPSVAVYFGTLKLKKGVDYTVSYETDKSGSGDVIITGKKNFQNSKKVSISITKKPVTELKIIGSDILYKKGAGAINSAKVTVKDSNGKTLVPDENYTVKYTYVTNTMLGDNKTERKAKEEVKDTDILPVGTLVYATVTGKGNYSDSASVVMRVYATSLSKVKAKVQNQAYTGEEVEPGLDQMTVTMKGMTLDGSDFEIVDYSNNVKKGTAKVTLKGKGEYGGLKVVNFKIVQKNF